MNIVKESVPRSFAGQGSVGTIEQQLPDIPILKNIVIRAANSNLSWIAVGNPNAALNGFILQAGEQTPPIYTDSALAIIGGSDGQQFSWIAS
jgi:hypothetical protein